MVIVAQSMLDALAHCVKGLPFMLQGSVLAIVTV
jgi:hypothetical protein